MTKAELRQRLRHRRRAFVETLGPAAIKAAHAAIATRVAPLIADRTIVAGYVPIRGEVDPAAILATAFAVALPFVEGREAPLRFLALRPGDPLVPGPFGLMQPEAGARAVTPDVILTPMVGFDRKLDRLGQGAGHYDRAFAACPSARRIGLAWSVQEIDALAADPWDVPLHHVATERELVSR